MTAVSNAAQRPPRCLFAGVLVVFSHVGFCLTADLITADLLSANLRDRGQGNVRLGKLGLRIAVHGDSHGLLEALLNFQGAR